MPIKIFFKINLKTFHFFSMHGKTLEFLVWYPESGRTGFYGNISFVNQAKEAGPGGWVFPILLAGILTSILSNPAERGKQVWEVPRLMKQQSRMWNWVCQDSRAQLILLSPGMPLRETGSLGFNSHTR